MTSFKGHRKTTGTLGSGRGGRSGRAGEDEKAVMSSKKKSKSPKRAPRPAAATKAYSPRPGSVPEWIFKSLVDRPMLFGELSVHVGRATGMSGDNLASQLSAALRDLVVRGVVVRLHHESHKPVPGSAKNARGSLYSLVPTAKTSFRSAHKEKAQTPTREIFAGAPEPKQRDLSSFVVGAPDVASSDAGTAASEPNPLAPKPARMAEAMFVELKRAEIAARRQLEAIELLLSDPAWR
ncbi:MAG TPA: hypothetical protein VFA98_06290 [Thermoanaerobaculia bacterium]|nr:hypothetical protein [Thermoanaerobaculia bacterium]